MYYVLCDTEANVFFNKFFCYVSLSVAQGNILAYFEDQILTFNNLNSNTKNIMGISWEYFISNRENIIFRSVYFFEDVSILIG